MTRRRILVVSLALLASLAAWLYCRSKNTIRQPEGVLLFSFDAAVADHFGAYGYARATTPVTDRLGKQGSVFRNVYAVAPYTLSSFASMFTSKYPVFTNVVRPGDVIDPRDVTLAQSFERAGFATAGFVTNAFLARSHGYARGFETYVNYEEMALAPKEEYASLLRDVEGFVASVRGRRFFLLVHVLLPHNPYSPPKKFQGKFVDGEGESSLDGSTEQLVEIDAGKRALGRGGRRRLVDLYDANLRYGDDVLGRVLDTLRRAKRLESTDVIVTSDHGEAFGQHGRFLHNSTAYDEMIHIPLIIRPAYRRSLETNPEWLADNVDLFPTIADLANVPIPRGLQGWSLLRSNHPSRKPYVLSYVVDLTSIALRSGEYKFIRQQLGDDEYYDLRDDPAEKKNLMRVDPVKYSRVKTLAEYQAALARLTTTAKEENRPMSGEAAARLWALGYVSPITATTDASLEAEGIRVRYERLEIPTRVRAGETFGGAIDVRNLGVARWSSFGRFPVRLGIRWYSQEGALARESRATLPGSLGPGGSLRVAFELHAPDAPGRYRAEIGLIQEFVGWFSSRGQSPAEASILVQ